MKNRLLNSFRLVLSLFFTICLVMQSVAAEARAFIGIATPKMLSSSVAYQPVLMDGLKINPQNAFQIDFMMDTGDSGLDIQGAAFQEEANKLVRYFLAALTIPEENMWVNLSPYEADRMISQDLAKTEMGHDLLAQDYLLKQLSAAFLYPKQDLGKAFWKQVYQKAYERYGTSDIPVNTFHKVWITPDRATLYREDTSLYTVENHLKVMLERDYVAAQSHNKNNSDVSYDHMTYDSMPVANDDLSSEIMREIIIPAIQNEVNEGKHFAKLRQIYSAMILATWYKRALKSSLLAQVYANQSKGVGQFGVDTDDIDLIYQEYINSFKDGLYNFIEEDRDVVSNDTILRQYFSGGTTGYNDIIVTDKAALVRNKNSDVLVGVSFENKQAVQSKSNKKNPFSKKEKLDNKKQAPSKDKNDVEGTQFQHKDNPNLSYEAKNKKVGFRDHKVRFVALVGSLYRFSFATAILAVQTVLSPIKWSLQKFEQFILSYQAGRVSDISFDERIKLFNKWFARINGVVFFISVYLVFELSAIQNVLAKEFVPDEILQGPAALQQEWLGEFHRKMYFYYQLNSMYIVTFIMVWAMVGLDYGSKKIEESWENYLTRLKERQTEGVFSLGGKAGPSDKNVVDFLNKIEVIDEMPAKNFINEIVVRVKPHITTIEDDDFIEFLKNINLDLVFYEAYSDTFDYESRQSFIDQWFNEPYARLIWVKKQLKLYLPYEFEGRLRDNRRLKIEIIAQVVYQYYLLLSNRERTDLMNVDGNVNQMRNKLFLFDLPDNRVIRKLGLAPNQQTGLSVQSLAFGKWILDDRSSGFSTPLVEVLKSELKRLEIIAESVMNPKFGRAHSEWSKASVAWLLSQRQDPTIYLEKLMAQYPALLFVYDDKNTQVLHTLKRQVTRLAKDKHIERVFILKPGDFAWDVNELIEQLNAVNSALDIQVFDHPVVMREQLKRSMPLGGNSKKTIILEPIEKHDAFAWQKNIDPYDMFRMLHINPNNMQWSFIDLNLKKALNQLGGQNHSWSFSESPFKGKQFHALSYQENVRYRLQAFDLARVVNDGWAKTRLKLIPKPVVSAYFRMIEPVRSWIQARNARQFKFYDGLMVSFDDSDHDRAQVGSSQFDQTKNVGGIDLDANLLSINFLENDSKYFCDDKREDCSPFKGKLFKIKELRDKIESLNPVILQIRPITNLPLLLGLKESNMNDVPTQLVLRRNKKTLDIDS